LSSNSHLGFFGPISQYLPDWISSAQTLLAADELHWPYQCSGIRLPLKVNQELLATIESPKHKE
jgi:hypothetical protein